MNEKGFAATGILYTILVLFILLLLSIITMLYSRNNILNAIRNDVKGGIYNVVLNIKGEEITERINADEIEFNIAKKDITGITNIVCNNGSTATYDEDNKTVTITNLKSGTVCKMNDSLKTTVDNLDYTKNNIVMISDETLTSEVTFAENTDAEITLNSHQLNLNGKYFRTYGNLTVNGDDNSKIVSTMQVLNNSGTGTLIVNGGNYERTTGSGTTVYNEGEGIITIKNGKFTNNGTGPAVQNRVNPQTGGIVNINAGIFVTNNVVITNQSTTGIININQSDKPVIIISLAQEWKPAIHNGNIGSTGIINITGNSANECTSDYTKTTSGLCVYAEGDKNYTLNTANTAVANTGDGTININGGTYFGGYMGISNHYNGVINILKGNISSGWGAVVYSRNGVINICNANISSSKYDFYGSSNVTTGTINYSSNVKFTKGTNTPVSGGVIANIVPNYTGTCTQ